MGELEPLALVVDEEKGTFLKARVTVKEFTMSLMDVIFYLDGREYVVTESRTEDGFNFRLLLKRR
ncbi:MAG: hypothetical protein GXO65_05695 [Euryarchaeota archaeon]|nr:hypothetical protein [Euryarchaeota archaeon]